MPKNQGLTKLQERDLHTLAHAINDREKAIVMLRDQTTKSAEGAVAEAVIQGQDLIKAKAIVKHGDWQDWLKVQCPLVSYRSAARYMALAAKLPHVADLGEASSLRAALLLCDMEGIANQQKASKCPAELQCLLLFTRATKFAKTFTVAKLPEPTRNELRAELLPVVKELWPEVFSIQT